MGKNKNLDALGFGSPCAKYIPVSATERGCIGGRYYNLKPSWRFSEAWKEETHRPDIGFFGQTKINEIASRIVEELIKLEGCTWNEILIVRKKQNHEIPVNHLANVVQRILEKWQPGLSRVVSLRFGGRERLYGKIEPSTGAFVIMFWDPEHLICPSEKKHT